MTMEASTPRIMTVVAALVAVTTSGAALSISVTHAGPRGRQGIQGPAGPAGPKGDTLRVDSPYGLCITYGRDDNYDIIVTSVAPPQQNSGGTIQCTTGGFVSVVPQKLEGDNGSSQLSASRIGD